MTDEHTIRLTRRRALGGLAAIGVASAGAGLGTTAYFSDEEGFGGNSLEAGELDLYVDYTTSVDQGDATGETGSTTESGTIQGEESAVGQYQIADVKPGDSGKLVFCPRIVDNPAWLWVGSDGVVDYENGRTEPEAEVDETGGDPGEGQGELSESIDVTVSYCELGEDGDPEDPDDYEVIRELGNPDDYTLADLSVDLQKGFLLDGDLEEKGTQAYPGSEDEETQEGPCICVEWEVPTSVGNEIQTDSVEFDIEFYAEQERHNENPDNPFLEEIASTDEGWITLSANTGQNTVFLIELDDDVYDRWPDNPDEYTIEVEIDADQDGEIDYRFGYHGPGGVDDTDVSGGFLKETVDDGFEVSADDDVAGFTAIESDDQQTYCYAIDWAAFEDDNPGTADVSAFGLDGGNGVQTEGIETGTDPVEVDLSD